MISDHGESGEYGGQCLDCGKQWNGSLGRISPCCGADMTDVFVGVSWSTVEEYERAYAEWKVRDDAKRQGVGKAT